MTPNRRTFLKTCAAAAGAAALFSPRMIAAPGDRPPYPAAPNLHTSPRVSALVSGGTITKDGKLLPAVSAAHYTIESAPTLNPPAWTSREPHTNLTGIDGFISRSISLGGATNEFFRVKIE